MAYHGAEAAGVLNLAKEPLETATAHSASLALTMLLVCSGVVLVIAGADAPYQLWSWARQLRMTRQEIVIPTIKGYRRRADATWDYFVAKDPKIAYIRVTQFTNDTFDNLKAALDGLLADGMKGLILDLRFNPGGRLDSAEQVVDLFLKDGEEVLSARDGADVIAHLAELTPDRARAIGQAARARILAGHTYARRGSQVDALLREHAARLREASVT